MGKGGAAKGFTIVEMLVSLVIFSMIMLATLTAMRTFGNSQARIEQYTDHLDEMRQVTGLVRGLIGKAIPVPVLIRGRGYNTFFTGSNNHLVWVAPLTTGSGNGGVNFFRLSLQQNTLVLQRVPFQSTSQPPDWSKVTGNVLLEGVERIEFGYLPRWGTGFEWMDNWDLNYASPALVRLNIRVKGKYWPETVVRLDHGQLRR